MRRWFHVQKIAPQAKSETESQQQDSGCGFCVFLGFVASGVTLIRDGESGIAISSRQVLASHDEHQESDGQAAHYHTDKRGQHLDTYDFCFGDAHR